VTDHEVSRDYYVLRLVVLHYNPFPMGRQTPRSTEDFYLSIVVASRNDSHGGNILSRMRLFLAGLLEQTRQYRFPLELVFVEWNPPADQPRLHEVLPKPAADDYLTLRYITVPASIHRRFRRASDIPLFQMIAKNVGIRRARGSFILCANIDLLFSDELFRALTQKSLRDDTYYRANRCDVPETINPAWPLSEQLAWCQRNTIRRLGRDRRYGNINLELAGLQDKSSIKKWLFDKMALFMRLYWNEPKKKYFQLDLFACGDFTLMSREAWETIQGYLELDLYSLHIDSLGVIAANALGYRQHVFPPESCTYHISHPDGWGALSPLAKIEFLTDRPALDYALVMEVGMEILAKPKPYGLNPLNWGYADVELEELLFTPEPTVASDRTAIGA
jgi:hypothetical protein